MSGRQETVYLDLSWWLAQYRIKNRACHCKVKLPIQACSMGHASLVIAQIVFIKEKKVWKQRNLLVFHNQWQKMRWNSISFKVAALRHIWCSKYLVTQPWHITAELLSMSCVTHCQQNTSTTSLLHTPTACPHIPSLLYSLNRSSSPIKLWGWGWRGHKLLG